MLPQWAQKALPPWALDGEALRERLPLVNRRAIKRADKEMPWWRVWVFSLTVLALGALAWHAFRVALHNFIVSEYYYHESQWRPHKYVPEPDAYVETMRSGESDVCAYLKEVVAQERLGDQPGTVSAWEPGCHLPRKLRQRDQNATVELKFGSAADAAQLWQDLGPGGILVLRDLTPDLLWQASYQVHSWLYYNNATSVPTEANLGLPGLEFVTFFPSVGVFEKQTKRGYVNDTHAKANIGRFHALATQAGTDKAANGYAPTYHRFLDTLSEDKTGLFVEIGLGCGGLGAPRTAAASAEVWTKAFPKMNIQYIENNQTCVGQELPRLNKLGVSVHVGSQSDPTVLKDVVASAGNTTGMQVVVDDGSHFPADISDTFGTLFPHVAPSGLYIVEDIQYATWALGGEWNISSSTLRTDGTPIATMAVLAQAVTGAKDEKQTSWAADLLAAVGADVAQIGCSPGICVYRHA